MRHLRSRFVYGLCAAAATVCVPQITNAAPVSWSSPVLLDGAGADFTNVAGIVDAIYFGSSGGGPQTVTVNGITFNSVAATGDGTIAFGATPGGTPAFDLNRDDGTPSTYATYPLVEYAEDRTSADPDALTITLKNLTIGKTYTVQTLFSAGAADFGTGPRNTVLASFTDATFATQSSASPNIEYGDNENSPGTNNTDFYGAQVETGTFTATAATEYLDTATGIGQGNRGSVAAVTLSSPVPEPTAIGLFAITAIGASARRRRPHLKR